MTSSAARDSGPWRPYDLDLDVSASRARRGRPRRNTLLSVGPQLELFRAEDFDDRPIWRYETQGLVVDDDQLFSCAISEHSLIKAYCARRYAQIVGTAMGGKCPLWWIELFAGPGQSYTGATLASMRPAPPRGPLDHSAVQRLCLRRPEPTLCCIARAERFYPRSSRRGRPRARRRGGSDSQEGSRGNHPSPSARGPSRPARARLRALRGRPGRDSAAQLPLPRARPTEPGSRLRDEPLPPRGAAGRPRHERLLALARDRAGPLLRRATPPRSARAESQSQ